jgi:osmotically-inducible protein OsmY
MDDRARRYRDSEQYYGGYYGYERPRRRRDEDDERGLWDRAGDEVRSWFGDEEASRRRARDEREWSGGYREPERSSPPQRYAGPSWTRDAGYGAEGWERYAQRPGWGDPSGWGPEPPPGPHAGRGPRGYTRSDERIREDVCDRLAQHGYVDASDIDVRASGGEVKLEGSVRERREKRLAEDIAECVPGVRDVHNMLRVNRDDRGAEPGRPFRAA